MSSSTNSLEKMYARLAQKEEEDEVVTVGEGEQQPLRLIYTLVGKFLTEKNINFNAVRNILASLWRSREGMKIHDLGGYVFYHVLDMKKVLEGRS